MDKILSLLNTHTSWVIIIVIIIGVLVTVVPITRMNNRAIEITAVENAKLYTDILQEFRTVYTKEVISKIDQTNLDITITHDFKDRSNAIPLPASMTIMLGNIISKDSVNISAKLYSPYPFPFRKKDRGLTDQFAKDSWNFFKTNPNDPFYRIEEINDERVLRYAIADKMRPSCIECHNTHPQTPKRNWKVNDVRGILELNRPLSFAQEKTKANLYSTILLTLTMMAGFVALLLMVITKLKKSNQIKEALLREVHHRVKNNFQIITSLLRLGKQGDETPESISIFKAAETKLQTMGLIHDQLYKTADLEYIDIQKYLTDLAVTLIDTYQVKSKIELDIKVDAKELKLETLVPLFLCINEIISNSIKHAFTNVKNGIITIRMKKEGRNYSLIIGDNGKGFDDADIKNTGLQLVNIFVDQLEGAITQLSGKGTCYKITFPSRD